MIYTKTGDAGTTSLAGGSRVAKCDLRVEAYGTVDELNSQLGVVAELCGQHPQVAGELQQIQRKLFVVQTLLATEDEALYNKLPQLEEQSVKQLEESIDALQAELPQLTTFVIPGGTLTGAQCHVARCVCRRAERRVVELAQKTKINTTLLQYLNRLSDYLFVLSRYLVVKNQGVEKFL